MDENFKAEIDQNLKNMLMTHWLSPTTDTIQMIY